MAENVKLAAAAKPLTLTEELLLDILANQIHIMRALAPSQASAPATSAALLTRAEHSAKTIVGFQPSTKSPRSDE
jgi:hypothetical protein